MWNAYEYSVGSRLQNSLNEKYMPLYTHIFKERHVDIGCGDGLTTKYLADKNKTTKFIGIDPDIYMIKFAKLNNDSENIEYLNELGENSTIQSDSVTSLMCLHWIKEINNFAINVFDNLSSEGYLFIIVPNIISSGMKAVLMILTKAQQQVLPNIETLSLPYYTRSHKSYCDILKNAGFLIEADIYHTKPFELTSIEQYIDFIKTLPLLSNHCSEIQKTDIYNIFKNNYLKYLRDNYNGKIYHPETFSVILAKKI